MTATVKTFDAAEFLDNDEVIAAYLQDALEDGDMDVFLLAVADVVKARSMTRVAEESGLGRESLYKMLRPGAKPGFATVGKLLSALGVRFEVTPVKSASPVKRVRKLRDDAPVAVAAAKTVATKKRARA
jgi:probable addiction module antidote protein